MSSDQTSAVKTRDESSVWTDWVHIPTPLKFLAALSALGAALLPALYFYNFGITPSPKQDVWGQFGDFVGGSLNPIFGFSALIALLYTLVLQSRELRYSTEQLKKSAHALEMQNAVLAKQSFESTFFQLLTLYGEVVKDLAVELGRVVDDRLRQVRFEDRLCLFELHVELMTYLSEVERGDSLLNRQAALDSSYQKFYAKFGHLVGHYFRTIYNIIKFVDRVEMPIETKREYVNILRAQLSKYELGLLLYNCLSKYGWEKMRPLVLKYRLLKHVEADVLLRHEDVDLLDRG